jgi:hypothetical protein
MRRRKSNIACPKIHVILTSVLDNDVHLKYEVIASFSHQIKAVSSQQSEKALKS